MRLCLLITTQGLGTCTERRPNQPKKHFRARLYLSSNVHQPASKRSTTTQTMECLHQQNGSWLASSSIRATLTQGQMLTSSQVSQRIRELQELTWTMLLHANSCWAEAVNSHLWPHAMRLACEAHNASPTRSLNRSPVEVFAKSAVMPEPKHWQQFGCPVHVLDNAL